MSSLGIFNKETKTYQKVAGTAEAAVVDAEMSDTSNNVVQNKVIKSYVDGRTSSVAWNNITGKPSTYTPSSHTHDDRYYTESEINTKLNSKANVFKYDFSGHDVYICLGTATLRQEGDYLILHIYCGSGFNANIGQDRTIDVHIRTSNGTAENGKYYIGYIESHLNGSNNCNVYVVQNSSTSFTIWIGKLNYSGRSFYEVQFPNGDSWVSATNNTSTTIPTNGVALIEKKIAYTDHSHNYAGSSSAGGSANSAVKLDTATAGSATQPVYFSGGKPVACSYTLGKSVPSDAEFTDTKVTNTLDTYTKAYVTGTTSASTNTGTQIFDTGVYLGTAPGQLTLEGSSSDNYTNHSSVLNIKLPYHNNGSSVYGVKIVPDEYNSDYHTGLNIDCGNSTSPGMVGINVTCSVDAYKSTVYINRSGTKNYALQVPKGKSYIATIYSNSSTITISDREKKTDIKSISDKYEELFFKLQPRLFKFKDGTSGRIHIGAIAQEVEEALKEVGLSDTEFAGFVRQEKEYVVDKETGEITQEEGYDYYLRYEEFVMLLCHMLQKLYAEKEEQDNKISDLESRIVALESKLG